MVVARKIDFYRLIVVKRCENLSIFFYRRTSHKLSLTFIHTWNWNSKFCAKQQKNLSCNPSESSTMKVVKQLKFAYQCTVNVSLLFLCHVCYATNKSGIFLFTILPISNSPVTPNHQKWTEKKNCADEKKNTNLKENVGNNVSKLGENRKAERLSFEWKTISEWRKRRIMLGYFLFVENLQIYDWWARENSRIVE